MNMEEKVYQIPLEQIIPNRFQPRLTFDEAALNELAQSIKEHGIIQPLVLRKVGDKYEIIAGERRFKAAGIAGLKTVPAVISQLDDQKTAEVALVENIQRKNLTAIEEAKSYKNILDQGGMTQEQLADKLGVSQSTIANKMRLLNLCDEVQDALLNEKISERHARALLAVKDKTEQVKWLNKIINDRLTVRQLDIELKKALKSDEEIEEEAIPLVDFTPNIENIKQNALDINPQEGLHDIESMLKPSTPGEKTFDLSNPVDNIETLDLNGGEEEVNEEVNQNKFFNVLENSAANMNANNSIDDMIPSNKPAPVVNSEMAQAPVVSEEPQAVAEVAPAPVMDQVQQPVMPDVQPQSIIEPQNKVVAPVVTEAAPLPVNNEVEPIQPVENTQPVIEPVQPSPSVVNTPEVVENNTQQTQAAKLQNEINDMVQEQTSEPISVPIAEPVVEPTINPLDNSINNVNTVNLNDTIDPVNMTTPSDTSLNDDTILQNNPSNTFFNFSTTPVNDINDNTNIIEQQTPVQTEQPVVDNNTINVIEPVVEQKVEPIFDPMSRVNTLEPGYHELVEEQQGVSLNNAINDIRNTRDMLEQKGFNITMEEADLGDSYNIIINIAK